MGDELVPAAWGRRRVPVPTSAQPRCPDVIATVTQGLVSPPCLLGLFGPFGSLGQREAPGAGARAWLPVCVRLRYVACKCLVPGTETLPRGLGGGVRPRGRGASAWPAGSADDAPHGRWGRPPGKLEARVVKETQTVTTGHGGSARGRRGPPRPPAPPSEQAPACDRWAAIRTAESSSRGRGGREQQTGPGRPRGGPGSGRGPQEAGGGGAAPGISCQSPP